MLVNPKGKSLVYGVTKVVRGGGSVYLLNEICSASEVCSSRREGVVPNFVNSCDGFRVVMRVTNASQS